MNKGVIAVPAIVSICMLAGCASTGSLVSPPDVNLSNVEATDLGFSEQTFVLEFDVQNPNPFPLPVTSISYGVDLDGYRFAAGSTPATITVPASGEADFAISVELDLMRSAPQLLYIVRDGLKRDIPYQLSGEFALDLPIAQPLRFETTGAVRMREVSRRAFKAD
jgi:LEA14-like dessication related protein